MFFRSIRWRIAVPYAILILAAMLGLTIYVSDQLRRARLADLEAQLQGEALLMADAIAPLLQGGECADTPEALARRWAALLEARVTVIALDGTVLAESHQDASQMDNHLNRVEVQQALAEGKGSSMRFSQTMGYEMMYVAVPVVGDDVPLGVVRVALPLDQVRASVARLRQAVLTAALATAVLAVLLAFFIAQRTALPVRRLTQVAERLAEGDLGARLFPTTRDEVGQLTQAFNRMGEQLRDKVTTLAAEQGRLAAVLEHMADGVIITDETGQVQLINPAAAGLLNTDGDQALGRTFAQVVHHHQLIELWQRCRELGTEQVEAVELSYRSLFLQAIVTPFRDGSAEGYLVILQDLTPIRRLETVRRDFISNISHELRTPLAGLKALVDTLRDGAMQDPPAARRFLDRMDTEVDALTQIVQELLELSRIESGQVPLRLAPVSVNDVILSPIDRLVPQAERAGLRVSVDVPPGLPPVRADAERVQQVVTNLVHNAIKFTPPGGQVTVLAEQGEEGVVVSVRDSGVGIPADDLPRIFERFYKSDRARSGGGSGLGLAIAKHIIQGHGGRIWVKSVEGEGSTFHFSLRIVDEALV
jgi:two-component system phosphate regulon sensor histidine kinase PhoR